MGRETLLQEYRRTRGFSEQLCQPLAVDDYQIQSITETSPPKWHLAHVSWFFETFVLNHFKSTHIPFNPDFHYLFNSYYYTIGAMHPRPRRGLLSRPTLDQILEYRHHVDAQVEELISNSDDTDMEALTFRITLGLHHEQQHQELLLMDIKHNFSVNPLKPAYRTISSHHKAKPHRSAGWNRRAACAPSATAATVLPMTMKHPDTPY